MTDKSLKVRCTTVFSDFGNTRMGKWEHSSDGSKWQTFWDVKGDEGQVDSTVTAERKSSMEHKTVSDLVRKYFSDFAARNRKSVEEILTDDFTFHSPHDPQIGKTTYFEKCWPNGDNFRAFHIEKLFEKGNEAFVRYECETKLGAKFRNTEFIRIEGDKIKEVEVYYGSLPNKGVPEE